MAQMNVTMDGREKLDTKESDSMYIKYTKEKLTFGEKARLSVLLGVG